MRETHLQISVLLLIIVVSACTPPSPVDELFSWETKRMDGILGVPFRIDAVVLNEQIPIIKQYLYSSLFKD
ncbi:hypothetical protein E5353_15305 [Bacteroides caecimuris]|uniref:Uncharacterized protein n=1 Tax=Bacteroides caecimuris TaxID=1796613 RepID=A0A4S2CJT8_9BACE|nr:hypothetical protein E5353_15305 [Bacteroides caecimuris]